MELITKFLQTEIYVIKIQSKEKHLNLIKEIILLKIPLLHGNTSPFISVKHKTEEEKNKYRITKNY